MSPCEHSPPLPFVENALTRLPQSVRVLDVACGSGRHCCAAAKRGHHVVGVDVDAAALERLQAHLPQATTLRFDVEENASLPPDLGHFDVVITTFFLFRPLIPAIAAALRPEGAWWLETFHVDNRTHHGTPRREHFALQTGEAAALAAAHGLGVHTVDEGEHNGVWTTQLIARRPLG